MVCYGIEDIKKEIEKEIDVSSCLLDAWKKVEFVTKKDGKPFSVMSKNLKNADYKLSQYATMYYEKQLIVYTYSDKAGYINDCINCYETIKYMKDENKLAKKENYIVIGGFYEDQYLYDIDDIKQAINDRIERLEKRLKSLKNQLKISDTVYHDFKWNFVKLISNLQATTIDDSNDTTLFYLIKDTILKGSI